MKIAIYILLLVFILPFIYNKCIKEFGCILRLKFIAYTTQLSYNGQIIQGKKIVNNKIMYLFKDKVVIMSSKNPGNLALEEEDDEQTIPQVQSQVERIMHFGQIILDCGKNHNKLCHIEDYPYNKHIKEEILKELEKQVPENYRMNCIVIPFFDNGYKQIHDKFTILCLPQNQDLVKIIDLKNLLSRKIEGYQLKSTRDRFNGVHGNLKRKIKMVTYKDGKIIPIIARIVSKGIHLQKNFPKDKSFYKFYTIYELRNHSGFLSIVSEALVKKKIPENWNASLNPSPQPDCCLFFKGDDSDLLMCIGSHDGQSVENASDVCLHKVKELKHDINTDIFKIKLLENYDALRLDQRKLKNCQVNNWKIFKKRLFAAADYGIKLCQYIKQYTKLEISKKYDECIKQYTDQLTYEQKLSTFKNNIFEDAFVKCVKNSKEMEHIFNITKINKRLLEARIFEKEFLAKKNK